MCASSTRPNDADKPFAMELYDVLGYFDMHVFLDEKRLLPRQDAREQMAVAMKSCRVGLLLLSLEFFTDPVKEIRTLARKAQERRADVLPVFLRIKVEDTDLEALLQRLPLDLANVAQAAGGARIGVTGTGARAPCSCHGLLLCACALQLCDPCVANGRIRADVRRAEDLADCVLQASWRWCAGPLASGTRGSIPSGRGLRRRSRRRPPNRRSPTRCARCSIRATDTLASRRARRKSRRAWHGCGTHSRSQASGSGGGQLGRCAVR
jgi:hypothetical protein